MVSSSELPASSPKGAVLTGNRLHPLMAAVELQERDEDLEGGDSLILLSSEEESQDEEEELEDLDEEAGALLFRVKSSSVAPSSSTSGQLADPLAGLVEAAVGGGEAKSEGVKAGR